MSDNGERQLDWLDRARVYAALAETGTPGEAQRLLVRHGLDLPVQVIAPFAHRTRIIAGVRESGLAPALIGPSARNARRLTRLDSLCVYLEDRIHREDPPLDRELAGLLQQYRELMSLLLQHDAPTGGAAPEPAALSRAAEEVASALNLLEAMNHEQPPAGSSEHDLYDAARRLAAATGYAFPAFEPGEPLAGAGGDL